MGYTQFLTESCCVEGFIFRHDKQAFVIIENTLNVLGKGFSCVKEYK